MSECLLIVPVVYDERVTDPESVGSALDTLLATATSTPEILDEYGNPTFGDSLLRLPNNVDLQLDSDQLRAKSTTLLRVVVNYPDGRRGFAFLSAAESKRGAEFTLTVKTKDGETERKAVAVPREVVRDNTKDAVWLTP